MVGKTLMILSLISFFISTISANGTTAQTAIRLSEQDNGRTVDLACGSILEISLKGNPTTGYSWEAEALDPKMLKQIGEPEFIPDSQLYGSGGTIILKFLATGSGLTHLKVIYHRSFEKNVAPLAMFATDILIK